MKKSLFLLIPSLLLCSCNNGNANNQTTQQQEERTLLAIEITSSPASVKQYETLNLEEIKIKATYSDNSVEENLIPTSISLDTSIVGNSITGTVAYNGKTATFTIQVTPLEKKLISISVGFSPETVLKGETLSNEDFLITAEYSDNSKEYNLNPTSIMLDTSTVGEGITGFVSYNGKNALFTIDVVEKEDGSKVKRTAAKTFKMAKDKDFTIVNFADTQFENVSEIDEGTNITLTIRKCIEDLKPDLITFSGDNAWKANTKECYFRLCELMDTFKIPYFMIFGNHDRENFTDEQLASEVNNSEYGYMEKGSVNDDSYGNYAIQIKNNDGDLVHKVMMMDSRKYYYPKANEYKVVTDPVEGMIYTEINGQKVYGSSAEDAIRGEQITWYEDELANLNIDSTVITHQPLLQHAYVYEEYLKAVAANDQEKLAELNPIGNTRLDERICSCAVEYNFFDKMKEVGSTKLFLAGHDHIDNFCLTYEGIQLAFALKTGSGAYYTQNGCYPYNGCTKISIDSNGVATPSFYYVDPYIESK